MKDHLTVPRGFIAVTTPDTDHKGDRVLKRAFINVAHIVAVFDDPARGPQIAQTHGYPCRVHETFEQIAAAIMNADRNR